MTSRVGDCWLLLPLRNRKIPTIALKPVPDCESDMVVKSTGVQINVFPHTLLLQGLFSSLIVPTTNMQFVVKLSITNDN